MLDNKIGLRTLRPSLFRGYYEVCEVHESSRRFTPARADARSVHHLPLVEYGDESAHDPLRVEVRKPKKH